MTRGRANKDNIGSIPGRENYGVELDVGNSETRGIEGWLGRS